MYKVLKRAGDYMRGRTQKLYGRRGNRMYKVLKRAGDYMRGRTQKLYGRRGNRMYKVLKREEDRLFSPFQHMEYEPNKTYTCENFCTDERQDCAEGFYATDVDGIIYSFRNLPEYEVWECEVGGDKVELDQFKRRYETIRLIRHVPNDEVKSLALAAEESVGYKLAEALFPVNVLKVKRTHPPTEEEIKWLKQWIAVQDSVRYSDSVLGSVRSNVGNSIWDSM